MYTPERIDHWLNATTCQLRVVGIATSRLDCLVLLEDCLNTNRTQLLAHPEKELTVEQIKLLNSQIVRRARHEPLAYIRGKTEFYGREFIVNKHVLEPRPESETMIELLKILVQNKSLRAEDKPPRKIKIADAGSGSGCLGITAKLEIENVEIDLIDIDPNALTVTKWNVDKFKIDANCLKSDLLTDTETRYNVILANLPYVPDNFQINPAALHEPKLAIFGGTDGLDVYRRLFKQIGMRKTQPQYVLTESLPPQHIQLAKIASSAGFKLSKTDDFIQLFEKAF